MSKQIKGTALLLLTAMIWGASFVAQSVGMDYVGPFTFQATRQFLAVLALLPVIFLRDKKMGGLSQRPKNKQEWKLLLAGGFFCGVMIFLSCSFQQFGLIYTTAGKSGFITALYVVFVPLFGVFFKKRVGVKTWLAVMLAIVGMYILCVQGTISLGKGELLSLGSAICFSAHILVIDYFSPRVDGVRLSALQFLVSSVISALFMLLTEHPDGNVLLSCWLPICYSGILSGGVAFTLQILVQKDINPTVASLTMSLESVFAAVFGWLIIQESMSLREIGGALLMFCATVLAQLPNDFFKRRKCNG